MKSRSPGRRAVLLVALAAPTLFGCRSTMQIKTLLDDPARFDGRTVKIEGEVTESLGALRRGAYRVRDGTGTIAVVSESGGAPRAGAEVGVEGRFEALFTLMSESVAVIREQRRFTP
ncbi:MAG: hypothetical protein ACE5HF_11245 [Gemmatimonadota bacterium]